MTDCADGNRSLWMQMVCQMATSKSGGAFFFSIGKLKFAHPVENKVAKTLRCKVAVMKFWKSGNFREVDFRGPGCCHRDMVGFTQCCFEHVKPRTSLMQKACCKHRFGGCNATEDYWHVVMTQWGERV